MILVKLERFRKEIMGFAILLIIICHSTLRFDNVGIATVYEIVKQLSKIGVDLFFLMSGIGLFFSFSKNSDVVKFYKKRMHRIIPQYAIVVIIVGVVSVVLSLDSITAFLWKYSLISFYSDAEMAVWFIAAILLLYLLFSVFYRLLDKNKYLIYGLCVLIYCASISITVSVPAGTPSRTVNEAFFVRIPTFLVGMLIGQKLRESQPESYKDTRKQYLWIFLVGVVCVAFLTINAITEISYGRWIERFIFMPTAIFMALIFGMCVEKCDKRICGLFSFFGGITLELYLIHERILRVYDSYMPRCTMGSVLSNAAAVVISVFLSKLLSDVIKDFTRQK